MSVEQHKIPSGLIPLKSGPIISKLLSELNALLIACAKNEHMETEMVVPYWRLQIVLDERGEPLARRDRRRHKIAKLAVSEIEIFTVVNALEAPRDEFSQHHLAKSRAQILSPLDNRFVQRGHP